MKYNFDTIIDRNNTDAIKQEALLTRWGRNDLIPLWVADMDLATPPFIMEVLQKRCQHPILGYTSKPDSYYSAIINWLKKRYRTQIDFLYSGYRTRTCFRNKMFYFTER